MDRTHGRRVTYQLERSKADELSTQHSGILFWNSIEVTHSELMTHTLSHNSVLLTSWCEIKRLQSAHQHSHSNEEITHISIHHKQRKTR